RRRQERVRHAAGLPDRSVDDGDDHESDAGTVRTGRRPAGPGRLDRAESRADTRPRGDRGSEAGDHRCLPPGRTLARRGDRTVRGQPHGPPAAPRRLGRGDDAGLAEFVLPIKENMSTALTETLESQVPAEMKGILAGASSMFGSMSDSMFAMQIGQAVGALSESVLTGTEVGLPLLPHDTAVLIETNVDAFAADIDVDASEVRIYLA